MPDLQSNEARLGLRHMSESPPTESSERVRIRLLGELGNQLFEWATGYALSQRLGIPLELQEGESEFRLGSFRLDQFALTKKASWWGDSTRLSLRSTSGRDLPLTPTKIKRAIRWSRHATSIGKKLLHHVVEPDVHQALSPGHFELPEDTVRTKILRGYFQSWQFFEEFESDIRRQLVLDDPSDAYQTLAEELKPEYSLAIHLRIGAEGQAVLNQNVRNPTSPTFLRKSYESVSARRKPEVTVIFTDNTPVAKQWLETAQVPDAFIVDQDLIRTAPETLVLMSHFRDIIGSASTFSLWAGFLQSPLGTSLTLPRHWLDGSPTQQDALFRPGWLVV